MSPTPSPSPRGAVRPGGRSARVQAAVREAAAALVHERGHDNVTIPAVAERAGVNPTTIYRRWGDVQALLAEVAVTHLTAPDVLTDLGSFHADLDEWIHAVVDRLAGEDGAAYLRTVVNVVAERVEGGQDPREACVVNRRGQVELLIERARARGETVTVTPGEILDLVLSPIYYRVLFATGPIDHELGEQLVARALERTPITA
jgi:AcrR family transcriptional regulator